MGVQHGQTIGAKGYVVSPVRTGAERIVGYRTDDNFAHAAKQAGKVLSIDNESGAKVMLVQFEDGTQKTFDLGRSYGVMAGTVLPHNLETDLKAGDTFKEGDFIVYNRNFFDPDPLSPGQAVWKVGALARVAFVETTDTDEDSSAISETFSHSLESSVTDIRVVKMDFTQEIKDLVKEGQDVDIESILCTIESPSGDSPSPFDDESTDILKRIDAINPKAKHIGKVERIEVLYSGDIDDMSPSLKRITRQSDKLISRHSEKLYGSKTTGYVDPGFRIDNKPIGQNQAAVRIYITSDVSMGVGDKAVVAGQLKTVVGRVMRGENYTAIDKKPFDLYFGYNSALARIVESVSVMGFGNTLCVELTDRVIDAYRKG